MAGWRVMGDGLEVGSGGVGTGLGVILKVLGSAGWVLLGATAKIFILALFLAAGPAALLRHAHHLDSSGTAHSASLVAVCSLCARGSYRDILSSTPRAWRWHRFIA